MNALWLILACNGDPDQGTVVGNPGDAYAKVAPVSSDIQVDGVELNATQLWLLRCDGEVVEQIDVSLAEGEPLTQPVSVPGGRWCRVGLALDAEAPGVVVTGRSPDGADFELLLGVSWVELEAPGGLLVDGQRFVLELGEPDWLSAELLERVDETGVVVIEEGHAFHDLLADSLSFRSALFLDEDGDGDVSDAERLSGAVAQGDGREEDVPDTGSLDGFREPPESRGCGEEEVVYVAWLLLLPVLGLRRRRR